jgi:fimbrial chaperone protein
MPHRTATRGRSTCWALAMLLAAALPVHAGVFTVNPVRMYMGPRDRALAVTITNGGDSEMVLQAESFDWSQTPDGQDQLKPTDDLVLAPPIIKIAPRGRQVVRLALVAPRDASRQLTYRIIVREVPEAAPAASAVQVQVALAMNMPVFVTPVGAKRKLDCGLTRQAAGLRAACANQGTAYAQVRELRVLRDGQPLARFEGGPYILPGATRLIELKANQAIAPGPVQLAVRFDDGTETTTDLVLP